MTPSELRAIATHNLPKQVRTLPFVKAEDDYKFSIREGEILKLSNLLLWAIVRRNIYLSRQTRQTPFELLDLGCGEDAEVVKSINREFKGVANASGITAYVPEQKKHPAVKQANLEFLMKIEGVRPNYYDMIISKSTFAHLANPALSLLQAYDAVKPGGILLIDYLAKAPPAPQL